MEHLWSFDLLSIKEGVAPERQNQARWRAGSARLEPGFDPLVHREGDVRMTRRCGPVWSLGGTRERPCSRVSRARGQQIAVAAAATTVSAAAGPFLNRVGKRP